MYVELNEWHWVDGGSKKRSCVRERTNAITNFFETGYTTRGLEDEEE